MAATTLTAAALHALNTGPHKRPLSLTERAQSAYRLGGETLNPFSGRKSLQRILQFVLTEECALFCSRDLRLLRKQFLELFKLR